ncbi:MAG TPA: terminase large subunit [Rectinema sp.]|nr:terminase large subunit [Rectinema sp.]
MATNNLTKEQLIKSAYFRTIGYDPHPAQKSYHDSLARFRMANCGRRFGKTTMAAKDIQPKLLQPEKLFWIVGPTYDLAEKEFRVIWQDMIVKLRLGENPNVKKNYNKRQGDMYIHFKDRNTVLEVKSAKDPDSLVGEAVDGLILSEAAKHTKETWDRYLRATLSDRRGFADFTTTPEGFNWYYDLWLLGKDQTLPEYESWQFPSYSNTHMYSGKDDPEIKLMKRSMSSEAYTQEIEADFSSFVGKIFTEWDVNKHVKSHTYNPDWPNYMCFDWGFTNPLAAVEFQVSPNDEIFIWREHYQSYWTVDQHIQYLKSRDNPRGYSIKCCFGDAASPENVEQINAKFAPCYALGEAKRSITEGIELMKTFMSRDPQVEIDEFGTPAENVPAYFVDPSCVNVIREHNNYKAPESTKGLNVPEAGLKQDDHTIDAIRYGLMHVFKLGAIYSLADVAEINNVPRDAVPGSTTFTTEGILAAVNGHLLSNNQGTLQLINSDVSLGNGSSSNFENMEF